MSHAKIRASVSELVSFIKDKCIMNMVESINRGDINITANDTRKLSSIIDQSVSQAFSLGFGSVESTLLEIDKANAPREKQR